MGRRCARDAALVAFALLLAVGTLPLSSGGDGPQTTPTPQGAGQPCIDLAFDENVTEVGVGLPVSFESSGADWNAQTEMLYVVDDGGRIARMDYDGGTMVTWNLPGDLEGITVADPSSDLVYVGVENPDAVVEFDTISGLELRRFDLTGWMQSVNPNSGLEALDFVPDEDNPEGGSFYAGLQENGTIFVFDLPIVTSNSSTVVALNHTILTSRSDIAALDYVAEDDVLYAIFDGADRLQVLDLDGTLETEVAIPGGQNEEGVATLGCHLMFLAQEDGVNDGTAWRYAREYTLEALAGANGTISPLGNVTLLHWQNQSFTVTPDVDYHITDILVNDVSVGTNATVDFVHIDANVTIEALFEHDNIPPIAAFSIDPPNPQALQQVTFTSTSSDPDGSITAFRWTLGDGSPNQSTDIALHGFSRSGTYNVTLQVRDDDDATTNLTIPLVIANAPPVASFSLAPTAPGERDAVLLTDHSFDPDGDLLGRAWDLGDGSTSTLAQPPQHHYADSGTYDVSLTVTDDEGANATASQTLLILEGAPALVVEPSRRVPEDSPLLLEASAFDGPADSVAFSVAWDFDDGSGAQGDNLLSVAHAWTTGGLYHVGLSVQDKDGQEATATITVRVDNLAPSLVLLSPADGLQIDEESPLGFSAAGDDTPSDRDGLRYTWDFGDGTSTGWGATPNVTHTYTRAGTWSVRASVRDGDGASAATTISLTSVNVLPSGSLAITPASIDEDGSATATASALLDTPGDRDGLQVLWTFDGRGAGSGRSVTLSSARSGSHQVVAHIRDDEGGESTLNGTLQVLNVAPAAIAAANRTDAVVGQPLWLSANGSTDTPSDATRLTYRWSLPDDTAVQRKVFQWSPSVVGPQVVRLEVIDDDGALSTASVTLQVRAPPPITTTPPLPQEQQSPQDHDRVVHPQEQVLPAAALGVAGLLVVGLVVLLLLLRARRKGAAADPPSAPAVPPPLSDEPATDSPTAPSADVLAKRPEHSP